MHDIMYAVCDFLLDCLYLFCVFFILITGNAIRE